MENQDEEKNITDEQSNAKITLEMAFGEKVSERGQEKAIFNDYPQKTHMSKKTITIVVVAIIFAMLACMTGGILIGANVGIGGDMPLMIEAYKNLKKFYYKDISWSEFQKTATAAMLGGVDNFTGMYSISSTANPTGVGVVLENNIFNEHFLRMIYDGAPASRSTACMWYPTFDNAQKNVGGEDVADKQIKMSAGDELVALKINGEFLRVKNTATSYISSCLAASKDGNVSFFVTKESYGDANIKEVGFYQFDMTMESYYPINAQYFAPKEINSKDTAMIKYSEFTENSAIEFAICVDKFVNDSAKPNNLILDLRGNGGGRADILCYVAKFLLDPNGVPAELPIIKYDYNKGNGKQKTMFYETSSTFSNNNGAKAYYIGNVVNNFNVSVLCDNGTASCSEALIGALEYYNGTEIVGRKTYGKGVAQKICLIGGGKYQIAITNGFYYIPTREQNGATVWTESIHGKGFTPSTINTVNDHIRPNKYDSCVAKALENLAKQANNSGNIV
ncbi:MAG: S41 family peptidase [Clostridia bacterium]